MTRLLAPVLVAVAALALWQGVASLDSVDDLALASPAEVAVALVEDRSLLAGGAAVTALEAALGLLLALVAGVAVALGMHLVRPVRDATYPLLLASQAIPIVVLAPLLVLAFDYGIGPKLAIVALVCFFPVAVSTLAGLGSVDPEALKLMHGLGASRATTLLKLELPASLPGLFTGLRIAATVSVVAAVFGEWAGADEGLGRLVLVAMGGLDTPLVYAGVTALAVMAAALFALVALAERALGRFTRTGA